MRKEVKAGDILKNRVRKLLPVYVVTKVEPKYRPPLAYIELIDKECDTAQTYIWLNDDLSAPSGFIKVKV